MCARPLPHRFVLFPETIKPLFYHNVQSLFIGCIPMALATIVNGLPTILLQYWDAGGVNRAAVALWSIDAALSGLSTLLIPLVMFTAHTHRQGTNQTLQRTIIQMCHTPARLPGPPPPFSFDRLTAVWLLPVVPGVVASASGGLVAQHCALGDARSIVLASLWLWGVTVPLALMVRSWGIPCRPACTRAAICPAACRRR